MQINDRALSHSDPPYIIADVGVNHTGDIEHAVDLVDAVAAAGADSMKFQTFSADRVVTPVAPVRLISATRPASTREIDEE